MRTRSVPPASQASVLRGLRDVAGAERGHMPLIGEDYCHGAVCGGVSGRGPRLCDLNDRDPGQGTGNMRGAYW